MENAYITLDELKAAIGAGGAAHLDDDGERAIEAASRGIDAACARHFYRTDPSNDVVRYYTPTRWITLPIADLIGLTSLEADQDGDGTYEEEWTLNTDFTLEPLNAEQDGRPWESLRLHPYGNYSMPYRIPRGIKITGQFGWLAVPPAIKQATVILASKLMKRGKDAPFGILIAGMEVGAVARLAKTDPDVAFLIDPFDRSVVL